MEDTKTKIINDFYMIQDDLYAMAKLIKQYKIELENSEYETAVKFWNGVEEVDDEVNKMTETIEECINLIDFPEDDEEEDE